MMRSPTLCKDRVVESLIRQYLPAPMRAYLYQQGTRVLRAPKSANDSFGWTDFSKVGPPTTQSTLQHTFNAAKRVVLDGIILGGPLISDATHLSPEQVQQTFESALAYCVHTGALNGWDGNRTWGYYNIDDRIVYLDHAHGVEPYTIMHELGHAFCAALDGGGDGTGFLSRADVDERYTNDKPSEMNQTFQEEELPQPDAAFTAIAQKGEWFADVFARYYHAADGKVSNPFAKGRDLQPATRAWMTGLITHALGQAAA